LKLCGNTLESLKRISLNGKPYFRSSTNNVLIKWHPKFTSGRGFKALFTVFKPIDRKGLLNSYRVNTHTLKIYLQDFAILIISNVMI
jgi:hypothetical protein